MLRLRQTPLLISGKRTAAQHRRCCRQNQEPAPRFPAFREGELRFQFMPDPLLHLFFGTDLIVGFFDFFFHTFPSNRAFSI